MDKETPKRAKKTKKALLKIGVALFLATLGIAFGNSVLATTYVDWFDLQGGTWTGQVFGRPLDGYYSEKLVMPETQRLCMFTFYTKKLNDPANGIYFRLYEGGEVPLGGDLIAQTEVLEPEEITGEGWYALFFDQEYYNYCYYLEEGNTYWLVMDTTARETGKGYYIYYRTPSYYDWSDYWGNTTEYPNYEMWVGLWNDTDENPEGAFSVSGTDPASESTITTSTVLTFDYENYDIDQYQDFIIYFWEEGTGIVPKTLVIDPVGESGEEEKDLFEDFGIAKNSTFYLIARARYKEGYPYQLTPNAVSPEYYLIFDVEGFPETFTMLDFDDWYAENVDKFASSTEVASAVAGIFSPIFSSIGEFGFSALSFLDTDQAYNTGVELGTFIPLYRDYIEGIEYFFGGFPLVQIFIVLVILLIGIFIFRLILKFIPFIG